MKKILIGVIVLLVVAGGAWYLADSDTQVLDEVSPTATPRPSTPVSVSPTPTSDAQCIITIDGQKYDVTAFRYVHPGGDIYVCGTDMSVKFHDKHGDGAAQMQTLESLKIN